MLLTQTQAIQIKFKAPNGKTIKTNRDNKEVYTSFDKFQVL